MSGLAVSLMPALFGALTKCGNKGHKERKLWEILRHSSNSDQIAGEESSSQHSHPIFQADHRERQGVSANCRQSRQN